MTATAPGVPSAGTAARSRWPLRRCDPLGRGGSPRFRRAMLVAYAVVGAAMLGYAGSVGLRGGRSYVPWLDEDLTVVIQLAAGTLCAVLALTAVRGRVMAGCLAAGLLLWSMGDLTWQLESSGGAVPVPSICDALFLALYPLVFVAVVALVHERAPDMVLGSWLDGLLTALGTASLCAATGFAPIMGVNGTSPAEVLVGLAYPVGDLVLLSLSVGALTLVPGWDRQGLLLLTGGLLFAGSDATYLFQTARGTYAQGSWVDAGWPAAVVVLSLAAWPVAPARSGPAPGRHHRRAALPLAAFAVGTGVLVCGAVHQHGVLAPVLAASMLAVALARIVVLLSELRRLDLEHTLRVQAETAHRALAAREAQNRVLVARLAGLLDAAPVAIIEIDLDGLVTRWNLAAERIYGWTEAEARGAPAPQALPPADAQVRAAAPGTRVQGGHAGAPERHRRRDGTPVDVEVAMAALHDDAGQVTGWIRVVTDVSRRIELEMLLRHAQKMESVGRLSSGIAHEINTPIQFLGDNVRFLEEAFDDVAGLCMAQAEAMRIAGDPDARRAAEAHAAEIAADIDVEYLCEEAPLAARQARDGIRRITSIVTAMKAFGRPGDVHKSPSDLNECIRDALTVASNELANVATVELDLGELPPVLSHPGDIRQVVLSLLLNATHAVAQAELEDGAGVVRVTSRHDGDEAVIEVTDNGVGIPADLADKIFDLFFTTKPPGVATGQGLTLAHALVVARHGGTIDFRSTPDDGTTFVVRLPVG